MKKTSKLSKNDPHYKQLSPSNKVKIKTIIKTQREYIIDNKLKYLITKRKNKDVLSIIRYDLDIVNRKTTRTVFSVKKNDDNYDQYLRYWENGF